MESRREKLLCILRSSSSKLSRWRCNRFFTPSISVSLPFSLFRCRLMLDLKLLSSFLPSSLSLSLPGAKGERVDKVSCFCFGMSLLCDLAGFLKIDQRGKKGFSNLYDWESQCLLCLSKHVWYISLRNYVLGTFLILNQLVWNINYIKVHILLAYDSYSLTSKKAAEWWSLESLTRESICNAYKTKALKVNFDIWI